MPPTKNLFCLSKLVPTNLSFRIFIFENNISSMALYKLVRSHESVFRGSAINVTRFHYPSNPGVLFQFHFSFSLAASFHTNPLLPNSLSLFYPGFLFSKSLPMFPPLFLTSVRRRNKIGQGWPRRRQLRPHGSGRRVENLRLLRPR